MEDYIESLTHLSTCDVSDGLLNRYKIRDGGYFPNLTRWSGDSRGTVAGKAYTVLFAPVEDPRPAVNYIDSVPEGSFLVIALTKELQCPYAPYVKVTQACYGGLMSTRANYLKAAGSVIFGRIRDVDEHRNLEYPVFSYGLGTCAPKEAIKPVAVNVALEIALIDGSVQKIEPSDIIVGDEQGVVRIPAADVGLEPLLQYIKCSVEADELVSQDIKSGIPAKKSQTERRAILKQFL